MPLSQSNSSKVDLSKFGFHIPELMPDEFFSGYFGRFSIINSYLSMTEARLSLRNKLRRIYPELTTVPAIWAIAQIYEVDVDILIQQNTLMPLLSRISKPATMSQINKTKAVINLIKRRGVGIIKDHPCLCENCVIEDISYWGFSYWRRSHQLPGVDWCTKHNSTLIEADDIDAFSNQPAWFMAKGPDKLQSDEPIELSPLLQRYAQLIQDACEIDFVLEHKILKKLLMKAFIKKRGAGHYWRIFDGLEQLMGSEFPVAWVQKHFPKLVSTYQNDGLTSYNNILECNSAYTQLTNYMLMTALLYDDADEAMFAISRLHLDKLSVYFPNLEFPVKQSTNVFHP